MATGDISFSAPQWAPGEQPNTPRVAPAARNASFADPQWAPDARRNDRRGSLAGRNTSFSHPQWAADPQRLKLRKESVAGPFSFLNPTTAMYDVQEVDETPNDQDPEQPVRAKVQWNARDHRKGRHVLVLPRNSPLATQLKSSSSPHKVLQGIGRMFTMFPYWDVSWLVGVCFTIGCMIFIVCGLFYFLPIAFPDTEFPGEGLAGGLTSLIGATLFQVGAVLLFFESVNPQAETQFGSAVGHLFIDHIGHMHRHKDCCQKPEKPEDLEKIRSDSSSSEKLQEGETVRTWRWFPTWHDLRHHYIYEVGFLASATMSIGATIFYVCGIMAMPQIYDTLDQGVVYGVYFLTYLVGGIFFIIASLLYTLETQPNWHTPQPSKLGWHVGIWNLVGGIGWTYAASMGYCSADWCEYQGELALVWASIAFALGSAIQWYESLEKYVVILEG